MPSVTLSANEADFFGIKPDASALKKPAVSTKPAAKEKSNTGGNIKVLMAAIGFFAGCGLTYTYMADSLRHAESEKAASMQQALILSAKADSLEKSLKEEKSKAVTVPTPEFPASPMFQSGAAPQPHVEAVEKSQEAPKKSPEPVKKAAVPDHLKAAAIKPADAKPQPAVVQPAESVPAAKTEAAPPKFLPVLMLPSNKTHIASVDDGSVAWRLENGGKKTIKIGESLPNGETLMGVDPSSSTLWTDKQIISIIKE